MKTMEEILKKGQRDEAEDILLEIIYQPSNVLNKLLSVYNKEYSLTIKEVICQYILNYLNGMFGEINEKPYKIIGILIEATSSEYDNLCDCLTVMGRLNDSIKILVYLIYYISKKLSNCYINQIDTRYYDILRFLCRIPNVQKELKNEVYWGLTKNKSGNELHTLTFQLNGMNMINSGIGISIPRKVEMTKQIETFKDDVDYVESLQKALSIYEFDIANPPFEAFKSDTFLPFFLEGAFMPFLYFKEGFCHVLLNAQVYEIRKYTEEFVNELKSIQDNLHSLLFNLIKNEKDLRNNFLNYIRKLYKMNYEKRKMVYDVNLYITDGLAANMCNVLDKFCDKILQDRLSNKIDFFYFQRISNALENEEENQDIHVFNEKCNEFISTVFTYKILFMNLSYGKMFEDSKEISSVIDYVEPNERKKLESKINAYRLIFTSKFFHDQDFFLDFMIENAYKIEKENIKKNYPEFYNQKQFRIILNDDEKPATLLGDTYHAIILKFKDLFISLYNTQTSNLLIELFEILLNSNLNIHLKEEILKILFLNPQPISTKIFAGICDVYIKVHKFELYDKIRIRRFINFIIRNDHNKNIKLLGKNELKLVTDAIRDLEFVLSEALDAISQIKKFLKTLKELEKQPRNNQIEEEIVALNGNIKKYKDRTHGLFDSVEESFQIILYIIRNNIKLFTFPETILILTNTLNYNLKLLVGPKCHSLAIENKAEYKFEPKTILKLLCQIYGEFTDSDLLNGVVKGKDFNMALLKHAYKIAQEKKLLEDYKFDTFIKKIENLNEKQFKKENVLVYPDEFLDPLTCEVMRNPVKLLTSFAVIDKETFDLIMVGDGLDPFNRAKLDETKFEYEHELKKRLEEFEKENK